MTAPRDGFHCYASARLSRALDDAKRLRDAARDDQTRERAAEQVRAIRAELRRRAPANRRPLGASLRLEDRSPAELQQIRAGLIGALAQAAATPGHETAAANLERQVAEVETLLLAQAAATEGVTA